MSTERIRAYVAAHTTTTLSVDDRRALAVADSSLPACAGHRPGLSDCKTLGDVAAAVVAWADVVGDVMENMHTENERLRRVESATVIAGALLLPAAERDVVLYERLAD